MMINAEEEKQLLDQLGVVGSTQGTHYQQTVEFRVCTHTKQHTNTCTCIFTTLNASTANVAYDSVDVLPYLFDTSI